MDWYHDVRKYIKKTGLNLTPTVECRNITIDKFQKFEEQLQKIESERIKKDTENPEDTFTFQLIELLKKTKTKTLTRRQFKKLEKKELMALENVKTCYENFMKRIPNIGKSLVIKQDKTNGRNEQAVEFERLRELLNSRNSFNTWMLNKDITKKKNWNTLLENRLKNNLQNSLNEVIEAKKRELFEKTKKDLQATLKARKYQPSIWTL